MEQPHPHHPVKLLQKSKTAVATLRPVAALTQAPQVSHHAMHDA